MSGPMKKNKWQWVFHVVLALLTIIGLIASVSNLYGPRSMSSWFNQSNTGETSAGMNNMAISNDNNTTDDQKDLEIIASQNLIIHNSVGEYSAIHDMDVIKELKDIAMNFEYNAEYETDSAYNIRNYATSQSFVEGKLTNETPIELVMSDVSKLPEDLRDISISSYMYISETNEVYLINDVEDTAYAVTITNDLSDVTAQVNNFFSAYTDLEQPVVPVNLGNGQTYVTKNETQIDRLTYLQERQSNIYFLNHFFETPEDIHDYSLNDISRYYTDGRQLTINMDTFEVILLQEVADTEDARLRDQIEVTSRAMSDILPDQKSWLYTEAAQASDQMITYRKYIHSYPVFGNNYVSKTQFAMDGNQIKNIYLSSLTIQTQVTDLTDSYTVMSGEDALTLLNGAGYANEEISELVLGYRWVQNPETSRLVELIPSWHVQIGNEWFMIEDLVDVSKYPSLQTTLTESGEVVDLTKYFENLGSQESEEKVKTNVNEELSSILSMRNLSSSDVLETSASSDTREEAGD